LSQETAVDACIGFVECVELTATRFLIVFTFTLALRGALQFAAAKVPAPSQERRRPER
jgi:hypothetical protein